MLMSDSVVEREKGREREVVIRCLEESAKTKQVNKSQGLDFIIDQLLTITVTCSRFTVSSIKQNVYNFTSDFCDRQLV